MLKVKQHRQKTGFCGPSSLKMILEYYGVKKTEEELGKFAKCTEDKGSNARDLLNAAKKFGFKGFIKDFATIKDLIEYVEVKKIPIIVDWFSVDEGHYSVVVGLKNNVIYLQDPELGRIRKLDIKTFKRVWFDFPGDFIKSRNEMIIRRMIVVYK